MWEAGGEGQTGEKREAVEEAQTGEKRVHDTCCHLCFPSFSYHSPCLE